MKKTKILLLFMMLSVISKAQFYIEAGPSVSKFSHGRDRDIEPLIGYKAGIGDRLYFNKTLSIDISAAYHVTGTLINHDPTEIRDRWRDQWRMELHRAELLTVLNLHITKVLAIHGGGHISYMTEMKSRKWNWENQVNMNENDFHRIDYGPSFGFSLDLYGLILKANGNIGLPDIGYPGRPLGDWTGVDLIGVGGRHKAFKCQSLAVTLIVPTRISKYRKS